MTDTAFSLQSARDAAERDRLGPWVADFLRSPGSDNAPLGEQLTEDDPAWHGPIRLPLDQLHRLAGPEDQPVLEVVDEDEWRDDVEDMATQIEEGWEPPPLIVSSRNGQLVLEDGNHRAESLRRAGEEEAWAVVRFDDAHARERFLASR